MIPRRVFEQICERDQGFCLLALTGCLGEGGVPDHRANRGHGGSSVLDHPANLILACSHCNGLKESAIVRDGLIKRGLRVEKAATNAATLDRVKRTPIQSLDGDWWLLVSASERVNVTEQIEKGRAMHGEG